jgi:hypothetical protein
VASIFFLVEAVRANNLGNPKLLHIFTNGSNAQTDRSRSATSPQRSRSSGIGHKANLTHLRANSLDSPCQGSASHPSMPWLSRTDGRNTLPPYKRPTARLPGRRPRGRCIGSRRSRADVRLRDRCDARADARADRIFAEATRRKGTSGKNDAEHKQVFNRGWGGGHHDTPERVRQRRIVVTEPPRGTVLNA